MRLQSKWKWMKSSSRDRPQCSSVHHIHHNIQRTCTCSTARSWAVCLSLSPFSAYIQIPFFILFQWEAKRKCQVSAKLSSFSVITKQHVKAQESFASTDRLQAQDGSVEAPSKEQSLTVGSWLLFSKIHDITKPGVKCTFVEWNTQASDRNLLSLPWPDDSLWFSKTLELWKESQEQNKLPLPSSQSIFA